MAVAGFAMPLFRSSRRRRVGGSILLLGRIPFGLLGRGFLIGAVVPFLRIVTSVLFYLLVFQGFCQLLNFSLTIMVKILFVLSFVEGNFSF